MLLNCFKNLEAYHSPALLTSTEADPDSFIENCVNVLTGDYCESNTDLSVYGPDFLILQRYYNTKNYINGESVGGWRIFPQCFLIVGKGDINNSGTSNPDGLDRTYAFTGERSGGLLTYSGWRTSKGTTINPLSIDFTNDAVGMVNTYAKDINAQNNHKNNLISCSGKTCEARLGDGTIRIYKKVKSLPSQIFGEELLPYLTSQVHAPEYFHLVQETLPSGNHIFFTYNPEGHLTNIEMKNASEEKTLAWLKLNYLSQDRTFLITITSSDEKNLEYHFTLFTMPDGSSSYALTEVSGSHQAACSYHYVVKDNLVLLTEKKFGREQLWIEYDTQGRVNALKKPNAVAGYPEIAYGFEYFDGYTEIKDIDGLKINYRFDERRQLTAIEKFDRQGLLYRTDKKVWGNKHEIGFLKAKYGSDGNGKVHYYKTYDYNSKGNVIGKRIYGNLSGQSEVELRVDDNHNLLNKDKVEVSHSVLEYSKDRFNLLIRSGESFGYGTSYFYKSGTNLCDKELIRDNNIIKKRILRSYNADAVCIQIIEDDGSSENEQDISSVTERHIKRIYPKMTCPGVGLPEILETKIFDPLTTQELLAGKTINTFNSQGKLCHISSYDADENFLYSEEKTYNHFGQIGSETHKDGHQNLFTYDDVGNLASIISSRDNSTVSYSYDFRNQLIRTAELVDEHISIKENIFDNKGRKTSEIDRFGNTTNYEYDEFGRLLKVIFPPVQDAEGNAQRPTFNYSYDIFGNVISETDPCNYTTSKSYNLNGKLSKINYPDGSKECFIYSLSGELRRIISRDNLLTSFGYDYQKRILFQNRMELERGRFMNIIESKTYKYSCFRCVESKENGLITNYQFDAFGRPIIINTYPENGSINDASTQTTEVEYNHLNQIGKKKYGLMLDLKIIP